MRVTRRRLHLGVPEQLADHRQAFAQRQRAGRKTNASSRAVEHPQGPSPCGAAIARPTAACSTTGSGTATPTPAPASRPHRFLCGAEHMARRLLPYFDAELPSQCIVNEYRPGQGIGMHADHRHFGNVVASLSLADDWPMRFRPRNARPYVRHGAPGDCVVTLPRRSALVLRGPARDAYMHGIAPADTAGMTATRISATFRTLAG